MKFNPCESAYLGYSEPRQVWSALRTKFVPWKDMPECFDVKSMVKEPMTVIRFGRSKFTIANNDWPYCGSYCTQTPNLVKCLAKLRFFSVQQANEWLGWYENETSLGQSSRSLNNDNK